MNFFAIIRLYSLIILLGLGFQNCAKPIEQVIHPPSVSQTVRLSAGDISIQEGGTRALDIRREGSLDTDLEIIWQLESAAKGDFFVNGGSFGVFPDQTDISIELETIDNDDIDGTRRYKLQISEAKNRINPFTVNVTILDDEGLPILTIGEASLIEGESVDVKLELSQPSAEQITLEVSSVDLTAIAGTDYEAIVSEVIVFEPGTTEQSITVNTIHNDVVESAREFNLVISNVLNAQFAGEVSTVVITDDDVPPVIPPTGLGRPLATGYHHSCAIIGGKLKCWGRNFGGALGDGTTTSRPTPVQVAGGLDEGVDMVAAGIHLTCALKEKSVRCWGYNASGQLGDGSVTSKSAPVQVSGLDKDTKFLSVGGYNSCAIKDDGELLCWGANNRGQLGLGDTTIRRAPIAVPGFDSGVTDVDSSGYIDGAGNYFSHTCAIKAGALFCWGYNREGQLGDGTPTQRLSPVAVSGLDAGVTKVVAGGIQTCAIQDTLAAKGVLKCWGSNTYGQVGNNSTVDQRAPATIIPSGVVEVAAGQWHTCALLEGGEVKCWGLNSSGQVGSLGAATSQRTPVNVRGLETGVTAIDAGHRHTCALQNGLYKCWGDNDYRQLGAGVATDQRLPVQVQGQDLQ